MRVVLLEPLGVEKEKILALAKQIEDNGHDFILYDEKPKDTAALVERAKEADAVILANLSFPEKAIKECENLKLISVAFTGMDHIGVEYCSNKGIAVANAAGYSTVSVAELTFGLIISVLRNITKCDIATREGKTKDGLIGFELCGKTLGIVGTGAIGLRVAQIGRAFGCKLIGYSRTKKEEAESLGLKYVDLDELMSESDIVTLHVPLTDSTKNLINKERLSLMKPTSILVNTARGPVIDNEALAEALTKGNIAGAGIDVFDIEPPLEHDYAILKAPNTVITPHVAFATKEALERRAEIAFDNVITWLKGL